MPAVVYRVNRRDARPVKWGVLLLGIGLLSACASVSVPTGPSVLALPAVGKPLDVFQAEEDGCRAYAQRQTAAAVTPRQSRYDIASTQCMWPSTNICVISQVGFP